MKRAIIIGATSGIGKGLAEILLLNDYKVGISGRREELLISFQNQNPEKIVYTQMDVQDISTLESKCNELLNKLGGLDLLIISAGTGRENKNLDFSLENTVIKTNIQGFTCVSNWGMNLFKKQGHGHLVNISSIAAFIGNGLYPSYSATKAYQINYLKGLRVNAYKSKVEIHITDVRPGYVNTRMAKGKDLFWVAPVKKAAKQIFTAINKKKRVVYITRRWRLIAWLFKLIPYSILKKL